MECFAICLGSSPAQLGHCGAWAAGSMGSLLFVKMRLGPFPSAPKERWRNISWLSFLKYFLVPPGFSSCCFYTAQSWTICISCKLCSSASVLTLRQTHFFLKNWFSMQWNKCSSISSSLSGLIANLHLSLVFLFKPWSFPCNFPVQRGMCRYWVSRTHLLSQHKSLKQCFVCHVHGVYNPFDLGFLGCGAHTGLINTEIS